MTLMEITPIILAFIAIIPATIAIIMAGINSENITNLHELLDVSIKKINNSLVETSNSIGRIEQTLPIDNLPTTKKVKQSKKH